MVPVCKGSYVTDPCGSDYEKVSGTGMIMTLLTERRHGAEWSLSVEPGDKDKSASMSVISAQRAPMSGLHCRMAAV